MDRTVHVRPLRRDEAAAFRAFLTTVSEQSIAFRFFGAPNLECVVAWSVDVDYVVVPAERVLDAARQCAEAGVRALAVISAGFAETGEEGARRQHELLSICRDAGMRLAAVEDVLLMVSALVEAHPAIVELDCNPLIARPDGAVIVDAPVRVKLVVDGVARELGA